MNIDLFVEKLSQYVRSRGSAKVAKDAVKKASEEAPTAVKKAPRYAAVKVNGLVVYMPVEEIPEGAEVLTKELNSPEEIIKAFATHGN